MNKNMCVYSYIYVCVCACAAAGFVSIHSTHVRGGGKKHGRINRQDLNSGPATSNDGG